MERKRWKKRKTYRVILEMIEEKLILMLANRGKRWKMFRHVLRHPEQPYKITLESMEKFEGKKLQEIIKIPIQH